MPVWITLTYPAEFPVNGGEVKRHWSAMRRWLERKGVGGFWKLEFQRRGAPHLHAWLSGRVPLDGLSIAWYRIVGSGDDRHLKAGTQVHTWDGSAPGKYIAKYAGKEYQDQVPDGFGEVGRFWGLFGGVKVIPEIAVGGRLRDVAAAIRVTRRAMRASRRRAGESWRRPFHDTGRYGFIGYGCASAMRRWFGQSAASGQGKVV